MLNEYNSSISLLQSYLTWLINMSSGELAKCVLVLFFAIFVILEIYRPRDKRPNKPLLQSYRTNIGMFVFNSVVMTSLSVPSLFILAGHYEGKGLLNPIGDPLWKGLVAFLAIDLSLYLLHRASHSFDCLWMFHKVHHNDPYLNVSTAFRIHFVEILIINTMKAMLVVILGVSGAVVLVSEAIITFFTMLHHTNISFKGEQFLGQVIITPYLHRTHHSTRRDEHDRNYGAVLSLWDRLFGTLVKLKPAKIGINGNSPQDFIDLLMFGFTMTTGTSAKPTVNLEAMIAEAAYYKAEKRGFNPGHELRDWLEAKSEIFRLVYGEEQVKNNLKQKWLGLIEIMKKVLNGKNPKHPLTRNPIN